MNAYIIDRNRVFATLEALENYSDKNKAVNQGLRKASRILTVAGRRSFLVHNRKKTGNLYKSLSYILKRRKLGSVAGFKRTGMYKGNHAHLIDQGTAERFTRDGKSRGRVRGSKFWEKAITQNEQRVYDTLYSTIDESIMRIINRR